MDVWLLRPRGYDLHPSVIDQARELARGSGGSLTITDDRDAALAGASAVYAKSWGSLETWGDLEAETRLRASLRDWCVSAEWMRKGDHARFMHCLPVRRNVVVRDEVLDGPWSVVVDQAENRLHAQTALLESVFASLERAPRTRSSARPSVETRP
jgi:ornithine carbamoyltransferase